MKKKTVLTVLLAAAIVLSLSVAALADFTQTITLTAPGEAMTVTVPTSVQLTLRQDATQGLVADGSSTIKNWSRLPIEVSVGSIQQGGTVYSDLDVTFASSANVKVNDDNTKARIKEAPNDTDPITATVNYNYNGTITDTNYGTLISSLASSPVTVTYTVEFTTFTDFSS